MTSRKTRLASDKYAKNITRRGTVPRGKVDNKSTGYSVGPWLLAFFLFVVVGSSIFQILRSAKGGGPFSK
ncbi:unnamed protein product [Ascophyllum nodosum]